jgi:hypothetical protein
LSLKRSDGWKRSLSIVDDVMELIDDDSVPIEHLQRWTFHLLEVLDDLLRTKTPRIRRTFRNSRFRSGCLLLLLWTFVLVIDVHVIIRILDFSLLLTVLGFFGRRFGLVVSCFVGMSFLVSLSDQTLRG